MNFDVTITISDENDMDGWQEEVKDEVVNSLTLILDKQINRTVQSKVNDAVDKKIKLYVETLISEMMSNAVNEKLPTLVEDINRKVDSWLTDKVDEWGRVQGDPYSRQTRTQWFITSAVKEAVNEKFKTARKEIDGDMGRLIQQKVAETIKK